MRKMSKILSAVLAAAMLLSMIVLPVSADETAIPIHTGETQTFELLTREGKELRFVPTENAKYILYTPIGSDFDCSVYECTDDGDLKSIELEWWYDAAEQYDGFVINAETGKTYVFLIYNGTLKVVTCSVGLVKAQNFENFELNYAQYSGYANEILNLSVSVSPQFAYETITWTSSDPKVVDIWDAINGDAKIVLMAPGTTVLTATSESGKTASCVITVKEKPGIEVGETVNVTLGYEEQEYLLFTPEESGRYILYFPQNAVLNMSVEESETHENVDSMEAWESGDGKFRGEIFEFEAGATYLIDLYNLNHSYGVSTTITLEKVQIYDFFEFECSELYCYEGDELILQIETGPATAIETISWISSDPNVAVFEFSSGTMAWFALKHAGTSTITATSASGKTTSCVIHVANPEMLTLDEAVTFSLKPSEYVLYQFTAPEAGVYSVYGAGDKISCDVYTEDEDGQWIQPDSQWTRAGIYGYDFVMSAGETYVFQFSHGGDAESDFEAMVSRPVRITGDVNGDTKITVLDLMRLANYFVGKDVEINEANTDVNGDTKITVLDLMRLANYFAGKAQLG